MEQESRLGEGESRWRAAFPLFIVVAGLAAYYSSFGGVFMFDDRAHILGDRRLKEVWPLTEALGRRRPVVDYSLRVNYEIGGENPWGYHLVNVTAHLLAATVLFGIVGRTLRRVDRREYSGGAAPLLALCVALLWVVHPLQTESVTYVVQRAESFMGLLYLLTLYCVIRSADSRVPVVWQVAAVAACALGMGSKAIMITAPVVVLVYDRTFLSKSFVESFRRRAALYIGLASTWGVLWFCGVLRGVLDPGRARATVGFGFRGITPLEYAQTQFGVVLEYLRLSFWPRPLVFDYEWPVAHAPLDIILPAIVIGGLVVGTLWALARRSGAGFPGVWFFVILLPTSGFIPIKDKMFEHRMYLSLAAVVVVTVLGGHWVLRSILERFPVGVTTRRLVTGALVMSIVGALGLATHRRNGVYHSEVGMWQDVLSKRLDNPRASENLGTALLAAGRLDEALQSLRHAVAVSPGSWHVHNGLGFALVAHGRMNEAIRSFREAIRLRPSFARAHLNLGNALSNTGRIEEAIEEFRAALRDNAYYSEARLNLANELVGRGDIDEAIEEYRTILRFDRYHASAWGNMGFALFSKLEFRRAGGGPIDDTDYEETLGALRRALSLNPESYNAYNTLGIVLVSRGRLEEAAGAFRQALRLNPNLGVAHFNLGACLLKTGEIETAVLHLLRAAEISPREASTRYELGIALERQGRIDEAIEEYRLVLRIRPGHPGARQALDEALAKKGGF